MADRIAVLDEGRIIQIGTPTDIYDKPATTFVARLVGVPRINVLSAVRENGTVFVTESTIRLPLSAGLDIPAQFLLGIRPEDVRPAADGEHTGEIILTEPLGVETVLHIQSGTQKLLSIVPGITDLKLGDTVQFEIVRERLHHFDLDGVRVAELD